MQLPGAYIAVYERSSNVCAGAHAATTHLACVATTSQPEELAQAPAQSKCTASQHWQKLSSACLLTAARQTQQITSASSRLAWSNRGWTSRQKQDLRSPPPASMVVDPMCTCTIQLIEVWRCCSVAAAKVEVALHRHLRPCNCQPRPLMNQFCVKFCMRLMSSTTCGDMCAHLLR